MNRSKWVGFLVGVTVAVVAADVFSDAGQGIRIKDWTLHPHLDLAGGYDTHPDRTFLVSGDLGDLDEADTFLNGELGLLASYAAFERSASLDLNLGYRDYQKLDGNDYGYGGERLALQWGGLDRVRFSLGESFQSLEDSDSWSSPHVIGGVSPDSSLDASARSRRTMSRLNALIERRLTAKMTGGLGYDYSATDFDSSTAGTRDLKSHYGRGELGYDATDKTTTRARVVAGRQDNDTEQAADYLAALVGLRTRQTDKLTADAGVGVHRLSGIDAEADGFHFEFEGIWQATPKIDFIVGARNGLQVTSVYDDNATEYSTLWATAGYRLTMATRLSVTCTYRQDDYVQPVATDAGPVDRSDDGIGFRARVDYGAPSAVLKLFGEASYEQIDSTVDVAGYDDRTRVVVGASVTY